MDKRKLSPMMQHYLNTKEEYEDSILFYRLGDFYEMFFDDAILVSKELELTLTGKDCGLKERAPMCGIPYHAAAVYIAKLIEKGYKVAICEQTEDPKTAKGMVKRDVIRVVTPGTLIDEELLDERSNNYLAVVYMNERGDSGISVSDASTGEVYAAEVRSKEEILNEIARYSPKEIIACKTAAEKIAADVSVRFHINIEENKDRFFEGDSEEKIKSQFGEKSLEEINPNTRPAAVKAVGAMLNYLEYAQKASVSYINKLNVYNVGQYMELDAATRRNLEITETMRDKSKRGSLLWVLDYTKTSMGARLLKQWVEKPLINPIEINKRLYSVQELADNMMLRDELGEVLAKTYDVSRIISRLSLATVTPRDMAALRETLINLPSLEYVLSSTKTQLQTSLLHFCVTAA